MLTLYHAPMSRSSRILTLLDELGAADEVRVETVTIPRIDGSGGRDARNPHPEGKVPLLVHDGAEIWETTAIVLYLCDLFPDAGMAPRVGDADRGPFLSWLAWYAAVVEPLIVLKVAELSHPILDVTFRGPPEMTDRLARALDGRPYLMGERYNAADLMLASPFAWFPAATPEDPAVRDWVARTQDRASVRRTVERDTAAMQAA